MEMKSLFEYLGKPAGSELGKQVAEAATKARVKIDSHHVETRKYTGQILKYPVEFLDSYFHSTIKLTAKDTEDDSLPF